MSECVKIENVKNTAIGKIIGEGISVGEEVKPIYNLIPFEADEVSWVLTGVDHILNGVDLYHRISYRAGLGQYNSAIGSTDGYVGSYLPGDSTEDTEPMIDDGKYGINSDDESKTLDNISDGAMAGHIYLDDIVVSAARIRKSKIIDAEDPSKVWKIDTAVAQKPSTSNLSTKLGKTTPSC